MPKSAKKGTYAATPKRKGKGKMLGLNRYKVILTYRYCKNLIAQNFAKISAIFLGEQNATE